MKVSNFWLTGAKRTVQQEWAAKNQELRREHWRNRTPAELIEYSRYRKLPKKRRQAIEAASYKST